MSTPSVVLRFKANPSPFIRAMHDAGYVMQNIGTDVRGAPRKPRKPYPKQHSGMTARQYRAARRRYARERRAYTKAMQTWAPNRAGITNAFRELAIALQPKTNKETD